MRITPRVRTTRPVQRQKHQRRSTDEQDRTDGVARPYYFSKGQLGILSALLWRPVEEQQAERGGEVEAGLDPEDGSPAAWIGVGGCSCSEAADAVVF